MTIQFTSLRGNTLTGRTVSDTKIKGQRVYFVRMLHKLYAITDGYAVDEAEESADMDEFTKQISLQL
jgi:hypothetical protein